MRPAIFALCIFFSSLIKAQDFDFLKFAAKNNPTVNTANIGLLNSHTITANYLHEELGFNGYGFDQFSLMYQKAFHTNRWIHGVGGHILYYDYGIEYLNATASYSLGYQLGEEHYIHIGLGLNNSFRFFNNLTFPNVIDPFYGFVKEPSNHQKSDFNLLLSNGIWYNYRNLIIQAQFTDWYVITEDYTRKKTPQYSIAYAVDLKNIELTPALGFGTFDRDLPENPYIEINAVFKEFILLGATYQLEGYSKALVGFKIKDWFNLGFQSHFFANPDDHNGIGLINYQLALQTSF